MRKVFFDRYSSRTDNSEIAWPKKGERLLQESSMLTPMEVSANLDWLRMFNDDLMMPDAYKEGADFLIEALRLGGDGTHPDRFTFPILYLYRHAVELKLKEMILLGIRLGFEQSSEKLDEILNCHELYPLWNRVHAILVRAYPSGDPKELSAPESMIDELHQTDRDGQHLRYPTAKDGQPFKHRLPERVDLLHLRTVFDGLWNFLDGNVAQLLDLQSWQQ